MYPCDCRRDWWADFSFSLVTMTKTSFRRASRPTKAQRREAERQLAQHGLAAHQLRSQQDVQPVVKPILEDSDQAGIQDHQFDRGLDGPWQADARGIIVDNQGVDDSDLARHHGVRTREHERPIPAWTQNDAQVRQVLLSTFPGLATDPKQRASAGRWLRIIYLYFRVHQWAKTIAESLGITVRAVESVIRRAREVGERMFGAARVVPWNPCRSTDWPKAA